DNEDFKCEFNKGYCNVSDVEEKKVFGMNNCQLDKSKADIDQMMVIKNDIERDSIVKDKYKVPTLAKMNKIRDLAKLNQNGIVKKDEYKISNNYRKLNYLPASVLYSYDNNLYLFAINDQELLK
ncbi:1139_t:CDS:2, partial [Racocetra persica]